ncbi:MAG: prolyl oligopeptidase family serine peptidase [Luteitalea sp.]|nr:prolyl oligopeptidase family serine peptidase [Luteitalea sp.]
MIRGVTATVCLFVILVATPRGTARQQEQPAPPTFTLDAIFDGAAAATSASRPVWSPDGTQLAYVWEEGDSSAIWVLDVESGKARSVFGLGDFSWAERDADPTQISEAGYQWAPDGQALLAQLETDLYLIDVAAGTARRLTETAERESDPRFSPDGTQVAVVRDFDLVLLDLESGTERVLTDDGDGDRIRNGIPDWVYWEELWGREGRGYWWSPEGGSIAYYRFDDSDVGRYPLANQVAPYPDVTWQRYPTAGTKNPTVQVGVLRLAGGATTWLQTGSRSDIYLARVDWAEDGSAVYVQRLNRDQTRLELLQCDPEDGRCKTLITEEQRTWVNLSDDYEILDDGRIVWPSERSGWKQLYLYSPDGALIRQLTRVPGAVASLESADEKSGDIIFTAFGAPPLGAARREVYRTSLEGGEAESLTTADGWNVADVAPGGSGYWIHGWSDANRPGESVVRNADGKVVVELPSKAATIAPEDLPAWELLTIPGPNGSKLPARMIRPPDQKANERYPVIMYHYGGPGSQVVVDRWEDSPRSLWLKLMAQRGYVVFSVDNLGSTFFGKRGEDRLHRRFGEVELAAQRAGVDYLSSLPFVDAKRIGIWGWSGGGFNTLYSLTHAPGVWRAAVAGAPVADLTFYDTIWMERYMDHPADNAEGYRDSSPLTAADKLRDRLLIVHGLADDNVHPNNSVAFVAKLTDAGIPFESAFYPKQKHGFRGPAERHLYERMTDFFERALSPEQRVKSSHP